MSRRRLRKLRCGTNWITDLATTAASALGVEHIDFREHWTTFGPVTAEMKAIEDLSLVGDARGVLSRADEGTLSRKALKKFGRPSANNWDRHRLDVIGALRLSGASNTAAALRRNARDPERPLALLGLV
ncbi:hypothetical protein [Streptomyces sp. NPDC058092]|uniref:hypothetical protein n=1 Tax=Streptomyces sp. NPDC058092 TaxID=3346336 RepID=UPI0036E6FE32